MSDWLLELRIRAVMQLLLISYRLQHWAIREHRRLVARRSPKQVRRMDRKRGLL